MTLNDYRERRHLCNTIMLIVLFALEGDIHVEGLEKTHHSSLPNHWRSTNVHLRGGMPKTKEEVEEEIRRERALEEERQQKQLAIQERKLKQRADDEMKQLAIREEEEARNQLVLRRQRRLPAQLTLESLLKFAKELLRDREYDEAIEAYQKVLSVDPTDVEALHDLAMITEGIHVSL
mmetsp:Transcript_51434/g.134315  ORF Transcript_51434/g.134315 Transcript_51434/m.134315 type:complete len:178 (-) Transcript_51434:46-579(-)